MLTGIGEIMRTPVSRALGAPQSTSAVRGTLQRRFTAFNRRLSATSAAWLLELPFMRHVRWRLAVKMPGDEVIAVIRTLHRAGISGWVAGGWGVDALAGVQTRQHRDVDVVIARHDAEKAIEALSYRGYKLDHAAEVPGFWMNLRSVLVDSRGKKVDLLPVDFASNKLPGEFKESFRAGSETVRDAFVTGVIAGSEVPCLSAELQLAVHQRYEQQSRDHHDVALLSRDARVEGEPAN
jgi:lincosamide nucleotidyltransferase A/C/D/E